MNALGVSQLSTTLRGTLSGTIKDSTGATLAGITVTAEVGGGGQGQMTTTSVADGSYGFTGLDVGLGRPYSVSFSDASRTYLPLDYDADPATPGTLDMVRVVAGQTTSADAVLVRYATLKGTVRDTTGATLSGVTVHARPDGGAQGELTTTSAADGTFVFSGIDAGEGRLYSVSFGDPSGDYLPLTYDADPATPATDDMVEVVNGATSTADAVLRRSCTLSGVVTDSRTGAPVGGVRIEPVLAPGQPAESHVYATSGGISDASGAYTITGIPDAVYVVACYGQAPVYGLQYWPAAPTAAAATRILLTPAEPLATADVVLHHDDTRPATAALNSVTMRVRATAKLKFRVTDSYGTKATLTLVIATRAGQTKARVRLGVRAINTADSVRWKPNRLPAGKYMWWVTATDLAGNTQSKIVKKALVLTR